ncbi:MAG: putative selenium-dependent hydroxylase accessory protein YqeC, partial [Oscillibacter sp.]|nr:putative selenium-dependent hydroxylase accessory protein YqeC [Oscillibacter sp.]
MELHTLLDIPVGVTAVIGSGGKTTLLRRLAEEADGTAILCTTTHIFAFARLPLLVDPTEADLRRALAESRVVCAGSNMREDGRLCACDLPFSALASCARYVFAEADGSRRLPLKAHAAHEPVIPDEAKRVICMVGASGFGKPIAEVVHRAELFCGLTGAQLSESATPALVARAIRAESLCDTVFLNQIDEPEQDAVARAFTDAMAGSGLRVIAGSL